MPEIPSPVATFVAAPNDTFNVTPVINFYVADGAYTPGEIIDFSMATTGAASVNFAGQQTVAFVTQRTDGSFTTQYY
jgi:hypothetical protein